MRRFADDRIEIGVPQGWNTKWMNDRVLFLSAGTTAAGPALLIELRPPGEKIDVEAMAASVRKSLGGSFRPVERRYGVSVFERENPPTRVAAGAFPDSGGRFTTMAIYWASAADYDRLGGLALMEAVARSAARPGSGGPAPRIVDQTLGYAGPSASSPATGGSSTRVATGTVFEGDPNKPLPPSRVTVELLAGTWRNTSLDSHMDTGRLDYSAEAGALEFTFGADGTFEARYKKSLISGVFRSETQVTETGRFELRGDRLVLQPATQRGWISVMSGRREVIDKPNGPARTYTVGVYRNYVLLRGGCAPYQVDLGCGTDNAGRARTLTFPLERVR